MTTSQKISAVWTPETQCFYSITKSSMFNDLPDEITNVPKQNLFLPTS